MSQVCCKVPTQDDVQAIKKSRVNPKGNALQGDIGERIAAETAVNELHLHSEPYDAPTTGEVGFDSVYRDVSGNLVIVESKMTNKTGLAALSSTKRHGKQGSVEWVEHHARCMCDPTSSQYSPDNARIGAEILRVGAENVQVVLIHTDPNSLQTTVHKVR